MILSNKGITKGHADLRLCRFANPKQGFSLASALGHSPKIVPDVRELAVQFVRDDFRKRTLDGNAQ